MRPLFFEEPENKNLLAKSESYFWGNDLLITSSNRTRSTCNRNLFSKNQPIGSIFIQIKNTIAGNTQKVILNKNYIPTFVRGGSFIPMIQTIQNTQRYTLDNFDLHFYFDATSEFSELTLYNDDGITPENFEKSNYEKFDFRSKIQKKHTKHKGRIRQNFKCGSF